MNGGGCRSRIGIGATLYHLFSRLSHHLIRPPEILRLHHLRDMLLHEIDEMLNEEVARHGGL